MFLKREIGALTALMIVLMGSGFLSAAQAAEPVAAPSADTTQPVEMLPEKPVIKKYGTWSTRCEIVPTTPQTQRCHAFIDVRVGERREPILYLGVDYVAGKPGSVLLFAVTPLGTELPRGISINIDNTTKLAGSFLYCAPRGCQSEIVLNATQLEALRNGKQIEIVFELHEQGEVKVPSGMDGFKTAFDSMPKP